MLLYKLDSKLDEYWWVQKFEDSIGGYLASVQDISTKLIFGKTVSVKNIRYGIGGIKGSDTLVNWWDYRILAKDFGMIECQVEPMAPVYLNGAIIDSVKYGYIVDVKNNKSKPLNIILNQNYPNPFNPVTFISYQLTENSNVKLKVFDLLGREIKSLVNEYEVAKSYVIKFDAFSLPTGTYFYQLQTKGGVLIKKMTLLK